MNEHQIEAPWSTATWLWFHRVILGLPSRYRALQTLGSVTCSRRRDLAVILFAPCRSSSACSCCPILSSLSLLQIQLLNAPPSRCPLPSSQPPHSLLHTLLPPNPRRSHNTAALTTPPLDVAPPAPSLYQQTPPSRPTAVALTPPTFGRRPPRTVETLGRDLARDPARRPLKTPSNGEIPGNIPLENPKSPLASSGGKEKEKIKFLIIQVAHAAVASP